MSLRFRYRASTDRGEVVEGISEARSRDDVLDQLRGRGLHVVQLDELPEAHRSEGSPFGRAAAVTRWCRSFAALLGAGTPLERALRVSSEQAGSEGLTRVLGEVREAVQAGEGLSDALAAHPRWFPEVLPAMARAGEAGGALAEVFEQAADYLEEVAELRSDVRAALVYPALMAVVAGLGAAVLLLFVVPRFSGILEDFGGTLPLSTRILVASGGFLAGYWWLVLGVVAAAGAAGAAWIRRPGNLLRVHGARLGWPVVGALEQKLLTARFTRTLGLLLAQGLPLLRALDIARASVSNRELARRLDEGIISVAEGRSLARSVEPALPPLAAEMLAVGEESGRLDAMCRRIADTYDREVRRSVKMAVALLEPAMIVVFGALVGLVALAMLQAIYSVNANLT